MNAVCKRNTTTNMITTLRIVVLCLLSTLTFGQTLRPNVKSLVDSIIQYDKLDDIYIDYSAITSERYRYRRLNLLTEVSSSKELLELTANKSSVIKCVAFQSLCSKDSIDIIPIVTSHLYDTSLIRLKLGCIGLQQMIGDYFLLAFYYYLSTKSSSYFINNHSRLANIDSLLLYDPKIRLAIKEEKIKRINRDPKYYDRIRDIAINERIPVSVLALAKYKKQKDKEIIKSYLSEDKTQYYAIWAVREFPDTTFYPLLVKLFNKKWRERHYNYAKWRILYQALAQYPNEKTLELFDKTINARNKFKQETLGRYLTIAITKYPNTLFDKYQNKVKIDPFHKDSLVEEANIED